MGSPVALGGLGLLLREEVADALEAADDLLHGGELLDEVGLELVDPQLLLGDDGVHPLGRLLEALLAPDEHAVDGVGVALHQRAGRCRQAGGRLLEQRVDRGGVGADRRGQPRRVDAQRAIAAGLDAQVGQRAHRRGGVGLAGDEAGERRLERPDAGVAAQGLGAVGHHRDVEVAVDDLGDRVVRVDELLQARLGSVGVIGQHQIFRRGRLLGEGERRARERVADGVAGALEGQPVDGEGGVGGRLEDGCSQRLAQQPRGRFGDRQGVGRGPADREAGVSRGATKPAADLIANRRSLD